VVFFLLWQAHYVGTAFHYPFTLVPIARPMPMVVAGAGACFNLVNSYLNGRYLFHFSPGYSAGWFADPRFVIGVAIFVTVTGQPRCRLDLAASENLHGKSGTAGLIRGCFGT
jgi:hypothetical protein